MDFKASNETSSQIEIIVVAWVFTTLAIAAVTFKAFTRLNVTHQFGWDDFFILLSLACSITATCFTTYSAYCGLTQSPERRRAADESAFIAPGAEFQMLAYPFNIAAHSLPNLSIAILIVKILDPNVLRARLLYSLSISQCILAFISILITLLQCRPVEMLWTQRGTGTCLNPNVFNYSSYFLIAYTTVTDMVLAIVPISAFWKLRLKLSTKVGLCVMMGLTMLSAITTIMKGIYLHLYADKSLSLYEIAPFVIWGLVEQNVVIIAACIPTLRPFFVRTAQAFKRGDNKSSRAIRSSDHSSETDDTAFFHQLTTSKGRTTFQAPIGETIQRVETEPRRSWGSHQGILRTIEVSVESDEDLEGGGATL